MALRHLTESEEREAPEGVTYLSGDEARCAYLEREIRRLLGMSGDEFLRRYDAGEYEDMEDSMRES